MADNEARILLTAKDETAGAFASAKDKLGQLTAAYAKFSGLAVVGMAAALVGTVKSVVDLGDKMNDLSQSVGVSVKDLGTWTLAASQSGTNIEAVARGIKGLSTSIIENGDALRKAGITATDANGALIQLADLFSALPDGVEKTALAVKLFGKAGLEMIPLLNQGSSGLQEAAEKSRKYGERMALLAPLADKFNDQLAEIELQSKETGVAITTSLMPGLIGVATWLNDLKAGGDRAAKSLEFLSDRSPLFSGLVKLHELFNGGEGRSQGYSGEKNALGLPISAAEKSLKDLRAFDAATEAYMTERAAKARALGILGKGDKGSKDREKAPRTYYEGLTATEIMRQLHAEDDAVAALRKKYTDLADPLQKYREELNEINQARAAGILTADVAIEAEFAVSEAMQKTFESMNQFSEQMKESNEFVREAARNIQDALGDGLYDLLQGNFDSIGKGFKSMLDRMVANAIAADLGKYLIGDIAKTGEVGGLFGDLLASLPKFATGTPYVPQTGLAIVHQGERIIPAEQNRAGFGGNIIIHVNGVGNAQDVRRAAGQGAREALAALAGARRYA